MDYKNSYIQLKSLKYNPISNKLSLIIIIIATLCLYVNTFSNEFAIDDVAAITKNSYVQKGFGGLKNIITEGSWDGYKPESDVRIYRPFQLLFFAIQYEFFELNPTPYHIIHVLSFALLNCLIFLLLKAFIKDKYPFLPLLITLLFAAHPIHTEVVANLKGSADLFGMLHATAAFLFLFKYFEKNKTIYMVWAMFFYFLSLISKEVAVTYIAVFPLALFYFTDVKLKNILKATLPFIAVIGVYILIRKIVFSGKDATTLNITYLDNALLLAETTSQELGMRLYSLGKYLQLLVYPDPLKVMYVYDDVPIVDFFDFRAISSLLIYALLTCICVYYFRRKNIIIFGILFYLITLALFSNTVVMMPNIIAERWLLIPSLGFCIVLGALIYKGVTYYASINTFFKANQVILIALSSILFLYAFKTIDRNADWKNDKTVFSADIKHSPNNQHILRGYGTELMRSDDSIIIKKGIKYLIKARDQVPHRYGTNNNLGIAYLKINDLKNAITAFENELKLAPQNSSVIKNLWACYNKVGINLMNSNKIEKIEESIAYFLKAKKLIPTEYKAIHNLGKAYYLLGQYKKSIEAFNIIYTALPEKYDSVFALAIVYNSAQEFNKALEVLLTLKEVEAYKNTPNYKKQLRIAQKGLGMLAN